MWGTLSVPPCGRVSPRRGLRVSERLAHVGTLSVP
jgi:hypothetical protein